MAYALITNGQGSANNDPTTGSLDTTGATLLIAACSYGGTPTGVTDSKGNTWVGLTARTNTGVSTRIFYVNSATPTVGTGHTFTLAGTGIAGAINVLAFSGNTAAPFVEENGTSAASGSTIAPGAVVPTEDGYLVVTGFTGGNTFGGAGTIGASFNITDQKALTGGVNYGTAAAYLIQSTAASVNPTWTLGSTVSNISSAIATFRVAGAAGFKKATVNASDVPATQTNFPSYVDLSRLGITTLAEAQSVRVYADSAKTTEWAREIVSATEMHVKVPSLTSTVTMYVDWDGVRADYAVTDTYGRNAVWSDYRAVYHLNDANDSTVNAYNLTNTNSVGFTAGLVGNAADYGTANTNKYLRLSNDIGITGGPITITTYVKMRTEIASGSQTIALQGDAGVDVNYLIVYEFNGGTRRIQYNRQRQATSNNIRYATKTLGTTTFSQIGLTYDNTNLRAYIDGVQQGADLATSGNGAAAAVDDIILGSDQGQSAINYLSAYQDETRIAAAALSANWLLTESNNMLTESSFWGTWSDVGGATFIPRASFFM